MVPLLVALPPPWLLPGSEKPLRRCCCCCCCCCGCCCAEGWLESVGRPVRRLNCSRICWYSPRFSTCAGGPYYSRLGFRALGNVIAGCRQAAIRHASSSLQLLKRWARPKCMQQAQPPNPQSKESQHDIYQCTSLELHNVLGKKQSQPAPGSHIVTETQSITRGTTARGLCLVGH